MGRVSRVSTTVAHLLQTVLGGTYGRPLLPLADTGFVFDFRTARVTMLCGTFMPLCLPLLHLDVVTTVEKRGWRVQASIKKKFTSWLHAAPCRPQTEERQMHTSNLIRCPARSGMSTCGSSLHAVRACVVHHYAMYYNLWMARVVNMGRTH